MISRFFRILAGVFALSATAAFGQSLGSGQAFGSGQNNGSGQNLSTPTLTMAPFVILENVLNIKVNVEYASMQGSAKWVSRLLVDSVKPGSIAAKAGLKSGMEILAIQGQTVSGLSEGAINNLLVQPVKDHLTLRVRKGFFKKATEINVPVPNPPPPPSPPAPVEGAATGK